MNHLRNCILLAGLLWPGLAQAGFVLTLEPAADQGALPGGTIVWNLQIDNLDPALYLSIDNVNTTLSLDPSEGTADNFASFTFPLVNPSTQVTSELFSIQWDLAATEGYSAGSTFQISTSYCVDSSYDGCVSNPDQFLAYQALVTPEPGMLTPIAVGAIVGLAARRRYRGFSE